MRCTSPLYRIKDIIFKEGVNAPSLFFKRRIFSHKEYHHFVDNLGVADNYFTRINCGQCLSCRILYAKQWATRCVLESRYHKSSYFCTFTYDDEHLFYSDCGVPTLSKRDCQLLLKRIRKHYGKVRFFCGAEYGDKTFRPHMHIILFGIELDDLVYYKTKKSHGNVYTYFNSPKLQSIWGKGFVVIGKVNEQTCSYTARYSLKKCGFKKALVNLSNEGATEKQIHDSLQALKLIEPCFSLMSRKPGIGRLFYDDNKYDIYENDCIPGQSLKKLRYYDKLFEVDEPSLYYEVKEKRQTLIDAINNRINCDYTEEVLLDVQRDFVANRCQPRDSI